MNLDLKTPEKLVILDCTLRDGGYYNKWDFSKDLVLKYLEAISITKINAIELGFRSIPETGFLGPFAFCTDDYLSKLPLPKETIIGVMINAKDYLNYKRGAEFAVDDLFDHSSLSPVSLVRIACHFKQLNEIGPIADGLKEKGYIVSIQMMQAGGKKEEEIVDAVTKVALYNSVDVIYFADSLGNMNRENVKTVIKTIRQNWNKPIGIHTHDNTGHALDNCMTAIKEGATWIDGTLLGMGRGPGNVRMEYLLIELSKRKFGDYYPEAIFPIVMYEFEKLKKEYEWGPNLLYYLSGTYDIHPTYVQELLTGKRYEQYRITNAMNVLKKSGGISYDIEKFQEALSGKQESTEGSWSAKGWAKQRDMLIVAPGPGARKHLEAVCNFIDEEKPVVICLNANEFFPQNKTTAYIACHYTRILLDSNKLGMLTSPIITPLKQIPKEVKHILNNTSVYDYGMKVEKGVFSAGDKGCTIPTLLVAAYTFALGTASGANRLLLVGFDGEGITDFSFKEMIEMINNYSKLPTALPLIALTPTKYPIQQTSIYSPII